MHQDLIAYSSSPAWLIADRELFPPAVGVDAGADTEDLPVEPWDRLEDAAARAVNAGRVAETTGDGTAIAIDGFDDPDVEELRIRVFVDEDPPEAWRSRRDRELTDGLLRVPTGTLVGAGSEDLSPGPLDEEAETFEIPPGDYAVVASIMKWEGDETWDQLSRQDNSAAGAAGFAKDALVGLGVAGTVIGVLGSPAWGLMSGTWLPVKVTGVMLVGYWGVVGPISLGLHVLPAVRRSVRARDRLATDYPDVVITLHRRGDAGTMPVPSISNRLPLSDPDAAAEPATESKLGCLLGGLGVFAMLFVIALIIALVTDWVSRW